MSIAQPGRLSYTRRDRLGLHDDVDRFLPEFITRIKDTSQANTGRLFLTIVEALVDNANYSTDQAHLEAILSYARQRKNILEISYMIGYLAQSTGYASVDLTVSMLSGVAPGGGQPIPIFTRFQTTEAPIIDFLAIEAATIPEGEVSTTVQAIQGIRIVDEVLTSSADGTPNQIYTLANSKTPHDFIEIKVDASVVDVASDFADGNEDEIIYTLRFDENDYTNIQFGDGVYGKVPPSGAEIKATYIQSVGEDGNAPAGTIKRIVGTLASTVGVTNVEAASGGVESESSSSIKFNAPAARRAYERVVTREDHETEARLVSGVYSAFAKHSEGSRTDTYIMPDGGGVASSYLVGLVQDRLDSKKIEGAVAGVFALAPASILITVNIVTFDSRIAKSTVKQKIVEATEEALDYTRIKPGRGFTLSDLSGIYESIDDGRLVDYADFIVLSRVPRIQKSNVSAPDFQGRVIITNLIGYQTYLVTALTTTQFSVSIDGIPQSTQGTVATEYTTDGGEVTFTLGETGDTLTIGDTWRFETSKYRDNLIISDDEFMRLEKSSDLTIAVFFPNEYDLKTQSAA